MTSTSLFAAFGKVSMPADAMMHEGRLIAESGRPLGHQVALIANGTPAFRLNTPGWLGASPQLIAALPDRAGLRLLCRDRLEAIVPAFAGAQRRWIARYLDRVEGLCGTEADLTTGPLERPSDRFFTALLPLPAVALRPVTATGGKLVPGDGGGFVAVDLAFWDGERVTAVFFGDENTASPRLRKELDNLVEFATPRLTVRRLTTSTDTDRLIDDMVRVTDAPPEPWFGPYRAAAFQAPLPPAIPASHT